MAFPESASAMGTAEAGVNSAVLGASAQSALTIGLTLAAVGVAAYLILRK